jgi:hypothetical protein
MTLTGSMTNFAYRVQKGVNPKFTRFSLRSAEPSPMLPQVRVSPSAPALPLPPTTEKLKSLLDKTSSLPRRSGRRVSGMKKGRELILGLNFSRLALRPCETQRGVTTHLLKGNSYSSSQQKLLWLRFQDHIERRFCSTADPRKSTLRENVS